jgi:glyoxylase-like metal-dependent hydrolase (beta-lactamase superfamily II)
MLEEPPMSRQEEGQLSVHTLRNGTKARNQDIVELLDLEFGIRPIHCSLPIPATVNIYFVKDPVPTLIDAPPEGMKYLEELDAGLRCAGYSIKDIKRVIITHPHFDHYGLSQTICERSGAEVWVFGDGAHWIEEYEKELQNEEVYCKGLLEKAGATVPEIEEVTEYYREANCFAHGARVSKHLRGGERFRLASLAFTVTHIPGHTPFCILLHDTSNSLAFTGDFLPPDIPSMPLVQWTDIRSKHYRSTVEYLASLKKVREMDLRVALPGHGQIILEPSRKINGLLGLIDERRKAVLAVLKKGSHTPVEIVREIFPHLPLEVLFRAVSDVMGHLEMLEMEGFAQRTDKHPFRFRSN